MTELFHNSLLVEKIVQYFLVKMDFATLNHFKNLDTSTTAFCEKFYSCYGCRVRASAWDVVKHMYPLRCGCMFPNVFRFIENYNRIPENIQDILNMMPDARSHYARSFNYCGNLNSMQSEILYDLLDYFRNKEIEKKKKGLKCNYFSMNDYRFFDLQYDSLNRSL
jgi:hypothetical protein